MSWPPIPAHFDYDDEFLDDSPPDDSDEVVYVSKVTGLPIGRETRQTPLQRPSATQVGDSPNRKKQPHTRTHKATKGNHDQPH